MSQTSDQPASGQRGDIYSEITGKIIAQIEAGVLPWVQPWAGGSSLSIPKNATTRKPYSGVNILLLWDALFTRGYERNQWLTFKQALVHRRGCPQRRKGHNRRLCRQLRPEEGSRQRPAAMMPRVAWRSSSASRFSISPNVMGFPTTCSHHQGRFRTLSPCRCAEARCLRPAARSSSGAANRLFIIRATDFIRFPEQSSFFTPINFYCTALHELDHWTAHPTRARRAT